VDFVVVGIFIGAIIVGAGAVVRDVGPRRRPFLSRRVRRNLEPDLVAKAWRRYCQAVGSLILTMGMIVVLATVVAMVASVSDGTGSIVVGVASVVAIALSAIGTFVISGHYQRGGFDPVFKQIKPKPAKAPPAVVVHDVEVPLSALPGDSVDDLFAADLGVPDIDTAASEPVVAAESGFPENGVIEEFSPDAVVVSESVVAHEPGEPVQHVESNASESEPLRRSQTPSPGGEPGARPSRLVPRRFQTGRTVEPESPAPPSVEWAAPQRAPIEQQPTPRRQSDPPLIDPDEELPAWNAPARAIPEPEPYVSPAPRPSHPVAPRPQGGAGFESSLLSDLDVPADEEPEVAGPFQSRLLNELTQVDEEPVEGTTDVLLDEFSLPSRNQPGPRDAENGR